MDGPKLDGYFVPARSPAVPSAPSPAPDAPTGAGVASSALRWRAALAIGALLVLGLLLVQVTRAATAWTPLVEPAAVRVTSHGGSGSYRFLLADRAGEPVRWDPCTPIAYAVNSASAPYATALDDVRTAFDRVSEVSGLSFAFVGETDATSVPQRAWVDSGGDPWPPVLVAWSDPGTWPQLRGTVVGFARAVTSGTPPRFVTGEIILDATADLAPGFGRGRAWGTTLLHEAGHIVGLGHVRHEGEVMHPGGERSSLAATIRWGLGDTEGLQRLGLTAGCLPIPPPPPAADPASASSPWRTKDAMGEAR